ncbi:hypothetical protein PAPYR_9575 [Paratrimastix pyriformis]|uniref:Uncharacterized protein n=1 Tax=Paratrimastix pyriformis TaxID=342808 RepID=A0ABQ8UBR9_9EUKA|nr:hypothetical protein PAPYR_9575 [Paratrimastix pyriformis]
MAFRAQYIKENRSQPPSSSSTTPSPSSLDSADPPSPGVLKFSELRDMWTLELTSAILNEFRSRTNGNHAPWAVMARFARKCVDANRSLEIDPSGNSYFLPYVPTCRIGAAAFKQYHECIAQVIVDMTKAGHTTILHLDIHGQSAVNGTVFRGTHHGLTADLQRLYLPRGTPPFGSVPPNGDLLIITADYVTGFLYRLNRLFAHRLQPSAPQEPEVRFSGGWTVLQYGNPAALPPGRRPRPRPVDINPTPLIPVGISLVTITQRDHAHCPINLHGGLSRGPAVC